MLPGLEVCGPWSSGSTSAQPGGSCCRSPFPRSGGVLVGPPDGGADIEVPGDEFSGVGLACSWAKIRCQVPSRCQRRNRSYDRAQGPYRSGTSRHGTPVRVRNRIAVDQLPPGPYRRAPWLLPRGNNGSRRARCAQP